VVALSIAIDQHPSLQSAQVGKLEPIAHLLGKLAGDPEPASSHRRASAATRPAALNSG
jgi:hypothetical protein